MKKQLKAIIPAILMIAIGAAISANAQTAIDSTSSDVPAAARASRSSEADNKNEWYFGYSYQRWHRLNSHGFEVSYTRNLNRYIGITADLTVHRQFFFEATNTNFFGGVQIKDNSTKRRFKPFARALIGPGFYQSNLCIQFPSGKECHTVEWYKVLSIKLGGGVDIKVSKRIDLRVFQFDFNPIRYSGGLWGRNYNIGAGIVIH